MKNYANRGACLRCGTECRSLDEKCRTCARIDRALESPDVLPGQWVGGLVKAYREEAA